MMASAAYQPINDRLLMVPAAGDPLNAAGQPGEINGLASAGYPGASGRYSLDAGLPVTSIRSVPIGSSIH